MIISMLGHKAANNGQIAERKMQDYWTLVQYAETECLRDKNLMISLIISQRSPKEFPSVVRANHCELDGKRGWLKGP